MKGRRCKIRRGCYAEWKSDSGLLVIAWPEVSIRLHHDDDDHSVRPVMILMIMLMTLVCMLNDVYIIHTHYNHHLLNKKKKLRWDAMIIQVTPLFYSSPGLFPFFSLSLSSVCPPWIFLFILLLFLICLLFWIWLTLIHSYLKKSVPHEE